MKIKTNLLINIIFATILLSFIIWNRFLRVRLPRNLVPTDLYSFRFILINFN